MRSVSVTPELAAQRYGEIRRAASAELRSGHRAAKAMESIASGPWQRSQFLAVRENFASDWQPRNGIEWTLIDSMAQAFTAQLFWQERLTLYSTLEYENDNHKTKERGSWNSPRVSDAEAVDQAATMVDRFHRMFVRAMRALGDLRRYTPAVIVQNAAQVNVGEQQVNVAMEKEQALPEAQAP